VVFLAAQVSLCAQAPKLTMATARMIIVKYFIFTFPSFLMRVAGKQLESNEEAKTTLFCI